MERLQEVLPNIFTFLCISDHIKLEVCAKFLMNAGLTPLSWPPLLKIPCNMEPGFIINRYLLMIKMGYSQGWDMINTVAFCTCRRTCVSPTFLSYMRNITCIDNLSPETTIDNIKKLSIKYAIISATGDRHNIPSLVEHMSPTI